MTSWLAAAVLLAAAMLAPGIEDAVASSRAGTGAAAAPTESEAKIIFYALIKQRVAAVEQNDYRLIEPLYAHDEGLLVLRPNLALRGWKAVQGYWQKSMSVRRTEPFRVYYNDDLAVIVADNLIVGALTWSNQAGQRPRNYGCLSLTLRRQGERWVIVQEHSSNWTKPSP